MKLVTCSHQSPANQANFLREFLYIVEVTNLTLYIVTQPEVHYYVNLCALDSFFLFGCLKEHVFGFLLK